MALGGSCAAAHGPSQWHVCFIHVVQPHQPCEGKPKVPCTRLQHKSCSLVHAAGCTLRRQLGLITVKTRWKEYAPAVKGEDAYLAVRHLYCLAEPFVFLFEPFVFQLIPSSSDTSRVTCYRCQIPLMPVLAFMDGHRVHFSLLRSTGSRRL